MNTVFMWKKMCFIFVKHLWEHMRKHFFLNVLCVYVHIPYVLLRQTFEQRFLGQMTSFIVCKLSYLIWLSVFSSYGVSQINSSAAQAYNYRAFSTPAQALVRPRPKWSRDPAEECFGPLNSVPWDYSFFILLQEMLSSVYFSWLWLMPTCHPESINTLGMG